MKRIIALIVAVSIASIIIISLSFRGDVWPPDSIFINNAARMAMKSGSVEDAVNILTDELIKAAEDMDTARRGRDNALRVSLYIAVCVFAFAGIFLCLYCERNFFSPFRKLQHFAHRIAAGNLDIPLEMDEHHLFGAFTECFDIMRDELRTARENEYKANQSKKELVASLSHDIKTPVASVMSAMELMLIKAKDDKEKKTIESVNAKLEQINTLVTNMFHATLEELQALEVSRREIQSAEIPALIQNADYEERVLSFSLPDCILLADPLRLQQVFDNIIHNTYKYALTELSIQSRIAGDSLIIDILDFGRGVSEEELPLLFNKYYRGTNSQASDGYGLGLYISKYLMEQMSGSLRCANRVNGFTVTLALKLAGADEDKICKVN